MLGTLNKIKENWGSVEGCVLALGLLSEEGITQLRQNLIVDAASDGIIDWESHAKIVQTANTEGDKLAQRIYAAQSQV